MANKKTFTAQVKIFEEDHELIKQLFTRNNEGKLTKANTIEWATRQLAKMENEGKLK
jgi:hypothetical protein|tara:strand:- start:452 stop:622 length:171 start_codon:yes stop_codon:yes gene_type:complete